MPKKILIIEDNVILGEPLTGTLKRNQYDVVWSTDGAHGLQKMKEFKPDLVLLDIGMPTMNGYDILEAKAQDPGIRDIPTIIISNSGEPVEINRVLALGVADYLVKVQITPDEVLEKVRNLFAHGTTSGATAPTASLVGKKILWAEDDTFLIDLVARRLANEGSVLVTSTSGSEVAALAEKEQPDIIMLDILMPDKDGFAVLAELKSGEATKHIPVIMFSNLDEKPKADQSRAQGAAGFFVKAMTGLDEIVGEIRKVVSKK